MSRAVRLLSATAFVASVATPAWAQQVSTPPQNAAATSDENGDGAIPDIVVTANKRSESINRVGLSITAVSGDALINAGVAGPNDLGKVVPGFYFTKSLYGTPVFTMRGVGFNSTALGMSPTVSVYVDQVPLGYPTMTPGATLDIERVEAIKGPQGVLFGNNSTGGAVNYIAASPTRDFHAGGTLTYGRFDRFEGEAYVSGPLSDTLRARLAVRTEQGGAWQVSQTRPNDRLGDSNKLFGRLLSDWTPTDRFDVRLSLSAWRDRSDSQARRFVALTPLIPGTIAGLPVNFFVPAGLLAAVPPPAEGSRAADWDPDRSFRSNTRFLQASLRGSYRLSDSIKLTSISAYSDLRPNAAIDSDGTAFTSLVLLQKGSIRSFFQELRADIDFSDKVSFLAGVNYEYARVKDSVPAIANDTANNLFLGQPGSVNDTRLQSEANTYSIFGKLDYKLTDTLKLTAAARYTADRRKADMCTYDVDGAVATLQNIFLGTHLRMGDCVTATNGVPGVVHGELNEDNVSWRAGLEWQVDPRTLIYATANRGLKAGGFPNVYAFDGAQLKPVVQEELNAYEVGAKLTFFDRRLQLNTALFHYDYKNKQIQGRVIVAALGPLETLVNVPKSKVDGAEVQIDAYPIAGLHLGVGASYSDTKIASGAFAYTPFGNFVDVSGQHFPGVPKWQVNADAAYERPVSQAIKAFGGGALVYTSDSNSAFGDLPVLAVPGYSLVDARVGLAAIDDKWRATLFVRNLLDKTYFTSTLQTIDVLTRYYGQPRTYGVTLQFKF